MHFCKSIKRNLYSRMDMKNLMIQSMKYIKDRERGKKKNIDNIKK